MVIFMEMFPGKFYSPLAHLSSEGYPYLMFLVSVFSRWLIDRVY
jgi:hypothetical protein